MKQVGKIYSSVDADELQMGDIVIARDYLSSFTNGCTVEPCELSLVRSETCIYRFQVTDEEGHDACYNLAKLICPRKHAEVYKAWKAGAKVEVQHPCYDDKWVQVAKPSWNERWDFRVVVKEDPFAELKKAYNEGKTIQILTVSGEWIDIEVPSWEDVNDYRIKPESEKRRMTCRELAKWLAQGNGQWKSENSEWECSTFEYADDEDTLVRSSILIRAWDETEWHKPLVEV